MTSLPTIAEILTQTNESRRLLEDSLGQSADDQISATATADTETDEGEGQGSDLDGLTDEDFAYLRGRAEEGDEVAITLLAEAAEEDPEQGSVDAGRRGSTRRRIDVGEQFEEAVLRGGRGRHSAPRNLGEAFSRRAKGVTVFDVE